MRDLRPARRDDVPAIAALQRALDVVWWGREDTDDADVAHGLDWVGDLDARSRVVPGADGLAGFASLTARGEATLAVASVLPPARQAEVTDTLVRWLLDVAPRDADGRPVLELGAPRQDGERLAALARHGLQPMRSEFDLERSADLPLAAPTWPEGVGLVPFADELAPALHALVYSVWTDVPGHHSRPYDEWRHLFLGHEPFDPGLQVVAVRDGRPVAVALCRVFGGADGWVSQLAVSRAEQGRGLGRAVLLESLRRLVAARTERVGLGVSARNPSALRLYRSVGLEVTREWVVCTPAGREVASPGGEGAGRAG